MAEIERLSASDQGRASQQEKKWLSMQTCSPLTISKGRQPF